MRRLLSVVAIIIVPLLGLLAAACLVVGQSAWVHERIQEAAARQLADITGREVRVGPVRGNVLTGLDVDGLAVARGEHVADGTVLSAQEMGLKYSLGAILSRSKTPAAAVREIRADGVQMEVTRFPDGRINLQDLLPPSKKIPPEKRFQGRVYLQNASISYTDYSSTFSGNPLHLELSDVSGVVDLRRPGWVTLHLSAQTPGAQFGAITADALWNSDSGEFSLDAQIADLDLPWAQRRVWPNADLQVRGGVAQVDASVYKVKSGAASDIGYCVNAHLDGARVAAPEFGDVDVVATGPLTVTPQGLVTDGLQAVWQGNQVEVSGGLLDFADPTLNLQVQASALDGKRVLSLLPEKTLAGLPGLSVRSPINVDANIVGPPEHACVDAWLQMSGSVTVAPSKGVRVSGDGVEVAFSLLDAAKPAMTGTVDVATVAAAPIPLGTAGGQLPQTIAVSPFRDVSAQVRWAAGMPHVRTRLELGDVRVSEAEALMISPVAGMSVDAEWAGGMPRVRTRLALDNVRAWDVDVSNLSAEAVLAGSAVHLRDLRGKALGGELFGEAVLDFGDNPTGVYANGTLSDIDIGELSKLPPERTGLRSAVQGRVDAVFAVEYTGGELSSAVNVSGSDLSYEGYGAARAAALARQEGDDIELLTAFAADPAGTVWANGKIGDFRKAPDSSLALDFQLAELRLGQFMERLGVEDIDGVLYAQGRIDGTAACPVATAHVVAYEPRYRQYDADALSADLAVDNEVLDVGQLLLTRGTAALSATGSMSNVAALADEHSRSAALADAEIAGRFVAAGVRLGDVAEMLGEDRKRMDGLAEARGVFGGTLESPVASGTARIAHAMTSTLDITEGRIPFELSDQVLRIDDATIEAQGSDLRVQASIDFRNEEPVLSASLSAGDISLEGIRQLQDMGLHVAGLLQIPVARIEGPLNDLTGQARVVSEKVQIEREALQNLLGDLTLKKGVLKLEHMRCNVAGGQVAATGEYHQDSEQLSAYVTVSESSASDLLSVAQPLVMAATAKKRNAAQQQSLSRSLDSISLRLRGQVYADVDITGSIGEPQAEGAVRLQNATLDGVALPQVQVAANADLKGMHDIVMEATQDDALITAEGSLEFGGEVNLLVIGSGMDLARYAKWMPLGTDVGGELGFTIAAVGQSNKPQIRCSVDVRNPQVAGIGFDVLAAPIVTLEEGKLGIDTLTIRRADEERAADGSTKRIEEEVVLDGNLPFSWDPLGIPGDRPMELQAKAEDTELALLPAVMNEFVQHKAGPDSQEATNMWEKMVVTGSVTSTVQLTGTPDEPSLAGFLQIQDASVALDETRQPLKDIALDLELRGSGDLNQVRLQKAAAVWDKTRFTLAGGAELRSLTAAKLQSNTYDLTLDVAADQQQLAKGLVVRDLGGKVALKGGGEDPPDLMIEQLGGTFGKGKLTLDGTASMAGFRLAELGGNRADMTLTAAAAGVALKGILEGVVDGTIKLAGPGGGVPVSASGKCTLAHGLIGIPAGGGEKNDLYALSSAYPKVQFDVKVALGPDMKVSGPGINAPLQPTPPGAGSGEFAVHLQGTPQEPVIEGMAEAQHGQTQTPGGVATINQLGVAYALRPKRETFKRDPMKLELTGDVWGSAETVVTSANLYGREIGPVKIGMALTGQLPDQWEIQVWSTPPLQESQIYALLGAAPFGYFLAGGEGAAGTDIQRLVSEHFLSALAAGFKVAIFEPLEQQLRRALGLSEFSVNFTFNQPVEIRIGKYLVENLLVSYRTALGTQDEEYDMTVSYEVGRSLRISYTTDERNRSRVQLERVWVF